MKTEKQIIEEMMKGCKEVIKRNNELRYENNKLREANRMLRKIKEKDISKEHDVLEMFGKL